MRVWVCTCWGEERRGGGHPLILVPMNRATLTARRLRFPPPLPALHTAKMEICRRLAVRAASLAWLCREGRHVVPLLASVSLQWQASASPNRQFLRVASEVAFHSLRASQWQSEGPTVNAQTLAPWPVSLCNSAFWLTRVVQKRRLALKLPMTNSQRGEESERRELDLFFFNWFGGESCAHLCVRKGAHLFSHLPP